MVELQIESAESDLLTLDEMAGDVILAGEERPGILLRLPDGHEEDLQIRETTIGTVISARTACEVRVPVSRPVSIRQVAGNLKAKGLAELDLEQARGNLILEDVANRVNLAEVSGNLRASGIGSLRVVGTVHGDASLKGIVAVDLQNVRGNLKAKASDQIRVSRVGGNVRVRKVRGALNIERVGGNALAEAVGGKLTLGQVAGNLVVKDLAGGARVDRIGGNLAWSGVVGQGCTYHFRVDGNASLRLDEDTNAQVTLRARGSVHTPPSLAGVEQDGRMVTGRLGDGGSEIVVEAGGNILVGSDQPGPGTDLGEEISRQVEEGLKAIDLEALGHQVGEEMEAAMSRLRVKLESVDWDRVGRQAQQAVESAMDRMQRDMDRMATTAARHQGRVERKMMQEARRKERMEGRLQKKRQDPAGDFQEPQDDAETMPGIADSQQEEERLSILRMVEQGQINPEEAEMLLDALAS